MIPFLVVDRPMSLKLLEFCKIDKQNSPIGLMGHANTTKNFQKKFKEFSGKNIVKMVDSGVFSRNGCMLSYDDLFQTYKNMGAEYGVMIDFLKNKKKTIKSAKKAIKKYNKLKPDFKLVVVAQGNDVKEYVECYNELKNLGFEYIAIGGLLKKNVNTARYVRVQGNGFLNNVLGRIREKHTDDWLFALGCYHPNRHTLFEEHNLFGGDYKGWIFKYKIPDQIIGEAYYGMTTIEFKNKTVESLIKKREKHNKEIKQLSGKKRQHYLNNEFKEWTELLNQIKNLKDKKSDIDKKIIKLKIEQEELLRDQGYLDYIKKIEFIHSMNEDEKRGARFKQVRHYLNEEVFSLL